MKLKTSTHNKTHFQINKARKNEMTKRDDMTDDYSETFIQALENEKKMKKLSLADLTLSDE